MTWTHDLAMLTSRLLAALREVELAREELERATHYEQATSRWWCDQVHRARAEERARVVAYLRGQGRGHGGPPHAVLELASINAALQWDDEHQRDPADAHHVHIAATYEIAARQIERGLHEEQP